MKKFISLVLSLLMLMSLFSVGAFADEPLCETFTAGYTTYNTMEGENFNFSTNDTPINGWYGGGGASGFEKWIRVEAKKGKDITIDRIEARVKMWPNDFDKIGFRDGYITARPINTGDYAVISGINNTFFEFNGGKTYIKFDEIKIYYHNNPSPTGSTISEGNTWIIAGIGVVAVVAIAVIVAKKKKKVTE